MQQIKKSFPIAILIVGILLLAIKWMTSSTVTEKQSICDLRKTTCVHHLTNGNYVSFEIMPKDISPLKPLNLTIKTNSTTIKKAAINFQGISMEMGKNFTKLENMTQTSDQIVFQGKIILPACMEEKMDWEAQVLLTLQNKQNLSMIPFRFYTLK